eukprot:Gb_13084 [translate_table: standard]
MAKRQRIEELPDQNGKVKMDSFNIDDDEAPLVFKRTSVSLKPKHANSLQNNSSSVPSQRSISSVPSIPRASLQAKSPLPVQKPSIQSNKIPPARSVPVQPSNSSSVTVSASAFKSSHSKHVSISTGRVPNLEQRSGKRTADGSESKPLKNLLFGADEDSEDSDDDKPLSCRLPASSKGAAGSIASKDSRGNSLIASSNILPKEPVNVQPMKPEDDSDDDSDDDKPLSARFELKPPTKTTGRGGSPVDSDDSDDDKPLSSRCLLNGLAKKDLNGKTPVKIETSLKKRPPDQRDNSLMSSMTKKAKHSGIVPEAKVKAEPVVKLEPEVKAEPDECTDDEDNIPIAQRLKKTALPKQPPMTKKIVKEDRIKKVKVKVQQIKKVITSTKKTKGLKMPPGSGEGQKWTTLEHSGVIFPPPYKPHGVKMLYNGQAVDLSPDEEEVATMFAVMKDTDYAMKPKFIENFWNDWKQILGKNHVIKKFELCDFTPIYEWHLSEKEKKKQMTTEEKKALKEEKLKQEEKYMWAVVDGVKEKVGNFRVEPPGLFRGRGEHPKMGKLKKRIYPEDITINVGKNAPIPECSVAGHRWKEIRHDNTVTWLAFWNDPINPKEFKYVFLAASSALKGQSDKEKYEKARMLKDYIDNIRSTYTKQFKSQDETKRQIAVATYLIDRLALRAGNEKDDDEADTVGCCTLKVENVTLLPPKSLQFDFLGKDSIRYFNTVEVDERVYKAIGDFKTGKRGGDDLFDKLDTSKLNAHLKEIMPGLTAKVFRTYNASITLDKLLQDTTGSIAPEKIADYQRANKEVAILCNHQRSVSKSHGAQMEKLEGKMAELEVSLSLSLSLSLSDTDTDPACIPSSLVKELETDLSRARKGKPPLKDAEGKPKRNLSPEMLEKKIAQTKVKIEKMKLNMRIKDDLKTVALGTSKINYLDPRISVAWCKRHDVPIEKIFNKSLLAKFAWAMDVEPDYRF